MPEVQSQLLAAADAANKEREKEKESTAQQRREKEFSVQSVLSRESTPATGIHDKIQFFSFNLEYFIILG